MTRRVLLGTAAGVAAGAALVGGARLTGRLDDVADAVGLDPKPEPDPRDTRLVRRAARAAAGLVAAVEATASRHPDLATALAPLAIIGREQVAAVDGGPTATTDPITPPEAPDEAVRALETLCSTSSTERAADCGTAVSPDLARVLASMSAGLAQAATILRGLR